LATYTFDNRQGQAVECLKSWKRGAAHVEAREFCDAFRTIMSISRKVGRPVAAKDDEFNGNHVR